MLWIKSYTIKKSFKIMKVFQKMQWVHTNISRSTVTRGPDSSVDIATGYGLDGPRIESRWAARFSARVQTGPGVYPASCTMDTRSFPGGKKRPERDVDPSPPSSAVGHERVELYLYSPYGPCGLYRVSVPVQGCTFLTVLMMSK
jgi:hypothetical protein